MRYKNVALLAFLLAGCATKIETKRDVAATTTESFSHSVNIDTVVTSTSTYQAEPSTITIDIETYLPSVSPTSTPQLIKKTRIVKQIGRVTAATSTLVVQEAANDTEAATTSTLITHDEYHKVVKPAVSCVAGGVIWGIAAVALAILGLMTYLKMR